MKKIQVRVIVGFGSSQIFSETIFNNITDFTSSSSGYYFFIDENNKNHYYPVSHTIIHQLE